MADASADHRTNGRRIYFLASPQPDPCLALPYRALTNKVVIQLQSEGRTPFGTVETRNDDRFVGRYFLPTVFDRGQISIATSSIAPLSSRIQKARNDDHGFSSYTSSNAVKEGHV
jgi:hypothetical protein